MDQEKAFDQVDWSFLLRVLSTMNFGASFRQWILLFYTRITSSVLINGQCSPAFFVTRGVRQGCPLSPLLYVIMAETIASAIPSDRRVKLCQYADDTSVFVMSDAALLQVFSLFRRYELASGAKLNITKSHGLLVGTWIDRNTFACYAELVFPTHFSYGGHLIECRRRCSLYHISTTTGFCSVRLASSAFVLPWSSLRCELVWF